MIPPFLYHYTSVESLLLILKNKTIRFSRLDCLNDPLEGTHLKFKHFNKSVFASSWTSEATESLPMWKIYSDLKGVRIKMPVDLFSFQDELKIKKSKNGFWHVVSELDRPYEISIDKEIYLTTEGIKKLHATSKVYGPSKIDYLASSDEISANVVTIDIKNSTFDLFEIDLNSLGLQKLNTWSFEKEYRYRIVFPDVFFIAGSEQVINSLRELYYKEKYFDVRFNENTIQTIEILAGPMFNEEEYFKLDDQLKLFDFNYNLIKSKIQIK